jgi:plasmid maintenance system antidote protein VapI
MSTKHTRGGRPRRVLSLGEHLRSAAKDCGLSVYRIAKETGTDQSTLNKFLAGTRDNLRLDIADRLFRYFFKTPSRKTKLGNQGDE